MMQVQITGNHVDLTPTLENYVNEKLQKIQKKFNNITNVHVTLSIDKKFQQKAEAHVHLARSEIHASSEDKDMYAGIDDLIDKLNKQVVSHKEKLSDHGDGEGRL
jgi:putative sigma-54 modulation protein